MIIGNGLSIKKYELKYRSLPPSFHGKRFIFLSDLHGEVYGKENRDLINLIFSVEPDFILIGGDMVVGGLTSKGKARKDSEASVYTSLSLLEHLHRSYKIYHAFGNHEEKLEKNLFKVYNKSLLEMGIKILDNASEKICSEAGEKLTLYGLSLGKEYYPKFKRRKLEMNEVEKSLGKKDDFSILLAHSPFYFQAYEDWGADLTLSGHLHGGIMRLPFIGGVLGSDFIPFPHYSGGLFENKEKKMIVSCGLGTHTIKLRIFNPPELTVIDLFGEN